MPISFNEVPNGIRVPFVYAEFDNANAVQGAGVQPYRTLMIGQKLVAGTKAENTKHLITSKEQAQEYFGIGSMLARQAEAYLSANKINELHCVALDDAGAGVAAGGELLLGGSPTKAGTLKLYISGKKAEVAVAVGDTPAEIVTALLIVLGADAELLVSSLVAGGTPEQIDFTAKNKGEVGNDIDLRMNYFIGDELPAGLTAVITPMSAGAGNPDVASALAILDDTQYMFFQTPYTDASNLSVLETELSDRFGPLKQNDGYHITAANGTLGTLNALGNSRNSQFSVIMANNGPSMPYVRAASATGICNNSAQIDPARPFQTLVLPGVLAEDDSEKFDLTERNILLNNGIATSKTDSGDLSRIERMITTYKKNPAGADDISYLDLNSLLTLSYLRFDFRNFWLLKYPRFKLASDGTQFAFGQKIMTPKVAKGEAIIRFRLWETNGLVENIDQFKEQLIVERNSADPSRLDFLLPPDIVNQLRVVGVKIGFLL